MKTLTARYRLLPAPSALTQERPRSLLTRLMDWCKGQQPNRLMWVGIILTAHGCILTPLTIMSVMLAGTNMALYMTAMAAMGAALVTNLAALPTKITLPVFILSLLIDASIIIYCIAAGMDITRTYIHI